MLPTETSLILILTVFLMRTMPSWFMRLLVMAYKRYILPFYLVVKSSRLSSLILARLKRMISSRKWQKFGVIARLILCLVQKRLIKLRLSILKALIRPLQLQGKLSLLSLSLKILRIKLNILKLLRKL